MPTDATAAKIHRWQQRLDDFEKQTGLKRRYERETTLGYGNEQAKKVRQAGKKDKEKGLTTGAESSTIITRNDEAAKIVYTGASGAIPRSDVGRMHEHAERFYEEIRKRTSDIAAIAQNTGISESEVARIKKHIFFNEYELGGEEVSRFDPDYDMAVSWQRLISGKDIQEMDIVMLRHELMEFELMQTHGLNYTEAHAITEKTYSYSQYVRELDRKEGLL
ncbi:MAG: hypothetical protein LBQ80_03460 [Clostridium sp.]|nr:hypothetical protein [Clostridium sp.]